MGVVYLAHDRERRERVALKTLRQLSADSLLRFKNEFRALQDLHHPNLVTLGELFEQSGTWFFTMEFLEGTDLVSWVRGGHVDVTGAMGTDSMAPTVQAESLSPSSLRSLEAVTDAGKSLGPDALADVLPRATGAPPPPVDEGRLRDALAQLAQGLQALHRAGKVHRDIKPSNILVTGDGRVVLLDFGLITDLSREPSWSDAQIVGTIDYMAPEQAASHPVGPEADWYSVGVLLFQILTGQLPFEGTALEVIIAKQKLEPPPPRSIAPDVPRDLDRLCQRLLRFDPEARPTGDTLVRQERRAGGGGTRDSRSSSQGQKSPFVGRGVELEELSEAFSATGRGEAMTVILAGESGVGKTALMRTFSRRTVSEHGAVVLQGRCYERESVPYKAFDGVIDALSRYLRKLSKVEAVAILPRQVSLLAQVFPVLRRVAAVAEAPRGRPEALDPIELRSRVFSAIRELLGRLVDRHPMLLTIDDIQWADADSLALLADVMRPPDAPALCLMATYRTDSGGAAELRTVEQLIREIPGETRLLSLERLLAADAEVLAKGLARQHPEAQVDVAWIAREAAGHPLFIQELVLQAVEPAEQGQGTPRLEDVLWQRIERLEPPVRRLLEVVAVAGGPLPQQAASQAAECDLGPFNRYIALLRVAALARTTGARRSDAVVPYHNRVRDAVLHHLDAAAQQRLHRKIALALEGMSDPDQEALTMHWLQAGEEHTAAQYAATAAARAAEALAFDQAVRLFRLSLKLETASGEQRHRLQASLGEALANAGRGQKAAEAYLAAAGNAPAADALELRRLAAEQLLRAGHIDQGLEVTRAVLGAVGLKLPRSPRQAVAALLMRRAQIRLRGVRFRERDRSQISQEDLTRIDVCWSVAAAFSMVDTIQGNYFQSRHLLLALASGEPYRICRALAVEAGYRATQGSRHARIVRRLLTDARALAARLDHPHATGMTALAAGVSAFLQGQWRKGQTGLAEASRQFRERCTGVTWEINTAEDLGLWCTYYLGDLDSIRRRVPGRVAEAVERGDLFAATDLRTSFQTLSRLTEDDPEGARREVAEAMGRWSPHGFQMQDWYELYSMLTIDLYEGRGAEAWQRVLDTRAAMQSSMFLRVEVLRVSYLDLCAKSALLAVRQGAFDETGLRRTVKRYSARLLRERPLWAKGLGAMLQAQLANLAGAHGETLSHLASAAGSFEDADMQLHLAVARSRLAQLRGESASSAARQDTAGWFEAAGVRNAARWIAALSPGFGVDEESPA